MKFSAREDIDAPVDRVFEQLCDFETFERQAIRRGAEVARKDTLDGPCVGMTWEAGFMLRGKHREMVLTLARFDRPQAMRVDAVSSNLTADFGIELIALSRTRTRVTVGLELKPQTLSARLLVQSLKLAKSSLNKRFKLRVAEYARSIEERLAESA